MSIQTHIDKKLTELKTVDHAYTIGRNLWDCTQKLIQDHIIPHLSEINIQLPEFVIHDATHSKMVLKNIENLLGEQGIQELTLAEAILTILCCYLHDTGMVLPNRYIPVFRMLEQQNPSMDDLMKKADTLSFEDIFDAAGNPRDVDRKVDFAFADTRKGCLEFLKQELESYRKYRNSLPKELLEPSWAEATRHIYLRKTHADRSLRYAHHLDRFFQINLPDKNKLITIIGQICASHFQEAHILKNLTEESVISISSAELSFNPRYLAMLLRLGDILHCDSQRAPANTLALRYPLPESSMEHWLSKPASLLYRIQPYSSDNTSTSSKDIPQIDYEGNFTEPDHYYFFMKHLDDIEEELVWYNKLMLGMHKRRIPHLLPETLQREFIHTDGFTADRELRFELVQQRIIDLLDGTDLYGDPFVCIRELYQNALDACRRMRNLSPATSPNLKIVFGLGENAGEKYLFCRDQGVGMTTEVIKKHLLRIGNSYYDTNEFRAENAQYRQKVVPVSQFGIGLISCYMIASRLEVITRHHQEKEAVCLSMKGIHDFGYYRPVTAEEQSQVGKHGTIVKLYLKEKFIQEVTNYVPTHLEDAVFLTERNGTQFHPGISLSTRNMLTNYEHSLYHHVQRFIGLQENGISVEISVTKGDKERILPLKQATDCYKVYSRYPKLVQNGFDARFLGYLPDPFPWNNGESHSLRDKNTEKILHDWAKTVVSCQCQFYDEEFGATASARLHLPMQASTEQESRLVGVMEVPFFMDSESIYISGIPICCKALKQKELLLDKGIRYNFFGENRPQLLVNRITIRSIPDGFLEKKNSLRSKLCDDILTKIRAHYKKYPDALKGYGKKHLIKHLQNLFDRPIYMDLLHSLSQDILSEYPCCTTTMNELFCKDNVCIQGHALITGKELEQVVLSRLVSWAKKITLADGKVYIQRGETTAVQRSYRNTEKYVVQVDEWPEEYALYDVVTAYPGFVPERVYKLLKTEGRGRSKAFHVELPAAECVFSIGSKLCRCNPVLEKPMPVPNSRLESGLKKHSAKGHYVLCALVSEPELEEYTIVFFELNNHHYYIAAKGRLTREEMISLLAPILLPDDPDEKYFFTDGTSIR